MRRLVLCDVIGHQRCALSHERNELQRTAEEAPPPRNTVSIARLGVGAASRGHKLRALSDVVLDRCTVVGAGVNGPAVQLEIKGAASIMTFANCSFGMSNAATSPAIAFTPHYWPAPSAPVRAGPRTTSRPPCS